MKLPLVGTNFTAVGVKDFQVRCTRSGLLSEEAFVICKYHQPIAVSVPYHLFVEMQTLISRFQEPDGDPGGIVFYGPHPCEGCGRIITKAAREQGGDSFDYPDGPIYPNSQWRRHTCEASE